jgi:hypothetical protein
MSSVIPLRHAKSVYGLVAMVLGPNHIKLVSNRKPRAAWQEINNPESNKSNQQIWGECHYTGLPQIDLLVADAEFPLHAKHAVTSSHNSSSSSSQHWTMWFVEKKAKLSGVFTVPPHCRQTALCLSTKLIINYLPTKSIKPTTKSGQKHPKQQRIIKTRAAQDVSDNVQAGGRVGQEAITTTRHPDQADPKHENMAFGSPARPCLMISRKRGTKLARRNRRPRTTTIISGKHRVARII